MNIFSSIIGKKVFQQGISLKVVLLNLLMWFFISLWRDHHFKTKGKYSGHTRKEIDFNVSLKSNIKEVCLMCLLVSPAVGLKLQIVKELDKRYITNCGSPLSTPLFLFLFFLSQPFLKLSFITAIMRSNRNKLFF